jgi:hypothetical protein
MPAIEKMETSTTSTAPNQFRAVHREAEEDGAECYVDGRA